MYETFNASSSESLDSIFNRLQKIVSQLTILGEIITPEELNLKFLRSLPTEWGMHVVVDDCYGVNSGTPAGSENKMLLLGAGETKHSLGWLGRDGEEVRWLEEGGAWCGRSDRSGEGEHFWSSPKNSPENFSGGGGGGRRLGGGRPWLWWPDFMEGKSV
ncbi:hypothetical protein Tco_0741716 [Tanacetum coccineum]